jgi:hypothetical protein
MEMRAALTMGMCGVLVAALGCGKVSKDNSKVVASVGGEQITEHGFNETLRVLLGDPAKTQDLINNQAMREQRNLLLGNLVNQKALFQFVKAQGLDKDPQVQLQITSATAGAYFQIMMDRLASKTEPTDAQLKILYDDYVLQAKANNQANGIPPFEQVKGQVAEAWKRKQMATVRENLLTQLNQKYPVTFAPGYQPTQQAAQAQ